MFDLGPAAQEMSRLVRGVRDDQLDYPTPCPDWSVTDLLAHVHLFATVFTHNARKEQPRPPNDLVDDWRVAIPNQLTNWPAPGARRQLGRAGYRPEASKLTSRTTPWLGLRS